MQPELNEKEIALRDYIESNDLLDNELFNVLMRVSRDRYIYITGVEEHQGKSELRRLMSDAGFTHVFERNEMYDRDRFNPIYGDDDIAIDKYARELFKLVGMIIDFGELYIPTY